MAWTNARLHEIETSLEVSLMCEVFEADEISPLAEALRRNINLSHLDLSFTNLTDEWFQIIATQLFAKGDENLKNLTFILNDTLLTNNSQPILIKLQNKVKKLDVNGNYFILAEALKAEKKVSEVKAATVIAQTDTSEKAKKEIKVEIPLQHDSIALNSLVGDKDEIIFYSDDETPLTTSSPSIFVSALSKYPNGNMDEKLLEAAEEKSVLQTLGDKDCSVLILALNALNRSHQKNQQRFLIKLIKKMVKKLPALVNEDKYFNVPVVIQHIQKVSFFGAKDGMEQTETINDNVLKLPPLLVIIKFEVHVDKLLPIFVAKADSKTIDYLNDEGCCALDLLMLKETINETNIKLLLKHKANPIHFFKNPNDGESTEKTCALFLAIVSGKYELVRAMINCLLTTNKTLTTPTLEEKALANSNSLSSSSSSSYQQPFKTKEIDEQTARNKELTAIYENAIYLAAIKGQYDIVYLLLVKCPIDIGTMKRIIVRFNNKIVVPDDSIEDEAKRKSDELKNDKEQSALVSLEDVEDAEGDDESSTSSEKYNEQEEFKKIKELLNDKLKEKEALIKANYHWVKSLTFSYYKKRANENSDRTNKWIEILGEDHHEKLWVAEARNRPLAEKKNKSTFATAGINFIVSSADGIDDRFVVLKNKGYSNIVDTVGDKAKFKKHLEKMGLQSAHFRINKQDSELSKNSGEIASVADADWEKLFNHSEQDIYYSLWQKEVVAEVVRDLKRNLTSFTEDKFKIEAVQINIFTTNYMCQNCQAMAVAIQTDKFADFLQSIFKEEGFLVRTSSKLPITVIISATTPFVPSLNKVTKVMTPEEKEIKFAEYRIQNDDKEVEDVQFDLRSIPRGHIFLKDLFNINLDENKATSYISGNALFKKQVQEEKVKHNKEIEALKKRHEKTNSKLTAKCESLHKKMESQKAEIERLKQLISQSSAAPNNSIAVPSSATNLSATTTSSTSTPSKKSIPARLPLSSLMFSSSTTSHTSASLNDKKNVTNIAASAFTVTRSNPEKENPVVNSSPLTIDKANELQKTALRLVEQSEAGAVNEAIACYQRALPIFVDAYGVTDTKVFTLQSQLKEAQQLLATLQLSGEGSRIQC